MEKIINVDFDGFFVPGNTKEEFAGHIFENAVNDWDIARVGKLIYSGLLTKHYLNEFSKYANAGNIPAAQRSVINAYESYDKIINGVPESMLLEFSEGYAKEFSKEGKDVLEELNNSGWELYIVSGAMQPCVETILEKNGVDDLFKGIYCNTLKVDNGMIRGLEKEIMAPGDKIIRVMKEKPYPNISEDITAVGHDIFDLGLLNAANLAVILDTVENPVSSGVKQMIYERRKEGKKTRVINNLYELPETLDQMEHMKRRGII